MIKNFEDEAKKLCRAQGLYKDLEETIDDMVQLIIQKKSEYLKNKQKEKTDRDKRKRLDSQLKKKQKIDRMKKDLELKQAQMMQQMSREANVNNNNMYRTPRMKNKTQSINL